LLDYLGTRMLFNALLSKDARHFTLLGFEKELFLPLFSENDKQQHQ